jgi:uroporphyrinogen decarboxylase
MKPRERIATILSHEEPDRVGFMDADTWAETVERWRGEGMPRDVDGEWLNVNGLRHFGMDIYSVFVPPPRGFGHVVIEDSDDFQVIRNSWGGKDKAWKHRSGPSIHLEPAVKEPEDFDDMIAPLFEVDGEGMPSDLSEMMGRVQEGFFVTVNVVGVFELAMGMFGGLGPTLVHMLRHPVPMAKAFMTIANYWAGTAEAYIDLGVDGLWVFDDLGSRNGPFFAPELYRQLLMPAHKRICDVFRRRNLPILLHSDGCLAEFVPLFLECGFNALHPIQEKAGMSLAGLKEKYWDEMVLFGGMNADVLASGEPGLIKQEVKRKIDQGAPGGGYIVASDGPVPPSVSLDSYRLFVKAIKRYGQYHST